MITKIKFQHLAFAQAAKIVVKKRILTVRWTTKATDRQTAAGMKKIYDTPVRFATDDFVNSKIGRRS